MKFTIKLGLVYIFLATIFVISACEKPEVNEPVVEEPFIPTHIVISPDQLTLNDNDTKSLFLSIQPAGELEWSLSSKPDWLEVSPTSGSINNDIVALEVSASSIGLDEGKYYGSIEIITNGSGVADAQVEFCSEGNSNITYSSVDSLDFGFFEESLSFSILNQSSSAVDWTWENSDAFLSATPISGNLAVDESVELTVTVDRSGLTSTTYDLISSITLSQGDPISMPINVNHYEEEKWLINGRVVDAEYDRINDLIVAVSETPNELRTFDVENNLVESVTLGLPPTCVSVSQDGNYAAVGHNGSFTYVDLSAMQIVQNYSVTTDAIDIILAPNEWVYVFPRIDQWETIRCIELATGAETEHSGFSIRAGTKAKLHPSGDYIYGANNGSSPSDFEKYDATSGTAVYMYDSPYHGDFAFSGDIWISDEGSRLFAKSRNVFNSSTTQVNDITYNGELAGEGQIVTLDYSTNANRIYAIEFSGDVWDNFPGNVINVYETSYLNAIGTIELPGFMFPADAGTANFFTSEGHFGFFNSSGDKYYVLVKAAEGSGSLNEWAIATIDVE